MSDLLWRETVRCALLGTGRAPGTTQVKDSAIQTLIDEGAFDSAESRLLTQAGLHAVHQLIGSNPVRDPLPVSLPTAPQPSPAPLISTLIGAMLDGRYKDSLPELLELLRQTGQSVPAERIPNLLAYAEASLTARHLVCQVLGPRGQAVAAMNPQWQFATADTLTWSGAQREWRAVKPVQRQAFLRQLRHLAPDFGRELLQSTWKAEPQHVRLWFMRIMRINLSMADEPFLEAALDDRALAVRKEAVALLASLPASRLCVRMAQRTQRVLTWNAKEQHLVVRFPVGINRLMQRDGVPVTIKSKNVARLRGNQLAAMVGAIPLDVWTERFGVSAETILQNLTPSKWPQTLLRAFTEAALRQQNAAWAAAILQKEIRARSAKLFNVLDQARKDAIFTQLAAVHEGALEAGNPLVVLAYHCEDGWSDAMVTAFLSLLVAHFDSAEEDFKGALLANAVRKLVKGAPPTRCDEIANTLLRYTNFSNWRTRLQDLAGLATMRKQMYAVLAPTASNELGHHDHNKIG